MSIQIPASLYQPKSHAYLGLFLTALATLTYEILLTRIFSAVTWYHFAFMAISLTMFGATAGALAVFLKPHFFRPEDTYRRLSGASLLFAASVAVSFLIFLATPFVPGIEFMKMFTITYLYLVLAVPFFFSGIVVCLTLARFPFHVSRLYARC